ncbi:hypothetical protein AGABI1DRAFT_121858 [Agaricus bisporus var. burnettii JB137-S8]|uniref:Uncharacterized protein n=1 Tax=Agaricus bisporus var. burnettii (strain JB137-S8 / ATCC MYA-4627 / FGSC 10392) TaxID=597362 RepID=K5XS79_AGABU|nr:uncharacterized protein AGABI1DRAFT_121858 [Agaricus bisporus var. burnettii JB137-S8]EKM77785.1 hypothetical protein AGABI1DRAFT_121858 [Agaricus bisporus var. burnettii JB137-S8]
MPTRKPYAGTERKLVLAFDVGTTFSGISYSILDPGLVPNVHPVTRFPGRSQSGGDAKVPTVIYYDQVGGVGAIGAETEREDMDTLAEEYHWVKAEWFKLHLRPKTRATTGISEELPPLPPRKTAIDLFADFFKYMKQCAKKYIEETHLLLAPTYGDLGMKCAQQTLMRDAAVKAGLVPATREGRERITFVTEGEASLNFCVDKGLMNESIQSGNGVTIVDAGGGTLDISTYARKSTVEHEYEEIVASQCHFKGSIFVTRAAATYLNEYLWDSNFHEDVKYMVDKFDKATKLGFRTPKDPQYIKFGNVRDKDPKRNIRAGQLRLDGHVIAKFFEPSIRCIVDAVIEQKRLASKPVATVFLVGGFAASDYLFSELEQRLMRQGFKVCRPDPHLNKAVPDGSIAGYLRPTVRGRVSKYTYGAKCSVWYSHLFPEHTKRKKECYTDYDGHTLLPGGFFSILEKNTHVSESKEFRASFIKGILRKETIAKAAVEQVTCYRGTVVKQEFVDQDPKNFHDVFAVRADLTNLIAGLRPCVGKTGIVHFKLEYEIIILFGLAEFKAQLAWKENGVEKRGPAEILFDTGIEYEE